MTGGMFQDIRRVSKYVVFDVLSPISQQKEREKSTGDRTLSDNTCTAHTVMCIQ